MTVGTINTSGFQAPVRRQVLRVLAVHLATLLLACTATWAIATIYLLARTDRGAIDVSDADAIIATAILAAAIPAWTAYQWRHDIHVATWRSVLRAALHPANLPAWLWVAVTLVLLPRLTIPALMVGCAALAIAVIAIASLLLLLLSPRSAPLHDRISRIRLRGRS